MKPAMDMNLVHIIALKDNRIYDLEKALKYYANKDNYNETRKKEKVT